MLNVYLVSCNSRIFFLLDIRYCVFVCMLSCCTLYTDNTRNSADAKIARHASRLMPPTCKTPHLSMFVLSRIQDHGMLRSESASTCSSQATGLSVVCPFPHFVALGDHSPDESTNVTDRRTVHRRHARSINATYILSTRHRGLTACTPGLAPGPMLSNKYGRILPF